MRIIVRAMILIAAISLSTSAIASDWSIQNFGSGFLGAYTKDSDANMFTYMCQQRGRCFFLLTIRSKVAEGKLYLITTSTSQGTISITAHGNVGAKDSIFQTNNFQFSDGSLDRLVPIFRNAKNVTFSVKTDDGNIKRLKFGLQGSSTSILKVMKDTME